MSEHKNVGSVLTECIDALKLAEQYLVQRGIEYRGTVGRTQVLPKLRAAIEQAETAQSNATEEGSKQ